jgi:hypothetical protein
VGRADLRRVEDVLHGERDAAEEAVGVSVHIRALARDRLLAGALGAQGGERAELGVDLAGPGKQRVQHLDGRQRAAAIRGEQLARRQLAEV